MEIAIAIRYAITRYICSTLHNDDLLKAIVNQSLPALSLSFNVYVNHYWYHKEKATQLVPQTLYALVIYTCLLHIQAQTLKLKAVSLCISALCRAQHLDPWLWMIMWQAAMLLSHWDQLSQVSRAFGTGGCLGPSIPNSPIHYFLSHIDLFSVTIWTSSLLAHGSSSSSQTVNSATQVAVLWVGVQHSTSLLPGFVSFYQSCILRELKTSLKPCQRTFLLKFIKPMKASHSTSQEHAQSRIYSFCNDCIFTTKCHIVHLDFTTTRQMYHVWWGTLADFKYFSLNWICDAVWALAGSCASLLNESGPFCCHISVGSFAAVKVLRCELVKKTT